MEDFIIVDGVLKKYYGNGGDVVIPEKVTSIGDRAFYECKNLTSVLIPRSVISIGTWAFYECKNLSSIVIPEGVISIRDGAFCECKNLISVTIPEGVKSIGDYAFEGCTSLKSIVIPQSVKSIGMDAFSWCEKLASVIIPEGITSIGNETFSWCKKLTSVIIPERITSIGMNAFSWCEKLTSVVIPKGVTSIGRSAFIGVDAFIKCSPETVRLLWESESGLNEAAMAVCYLENCDDDISDIDKIVTGHKTDVIKRILTYKLKTALVRFLAKCKLTSSELDEYIESCEDAEMKTYLIEYRAKHFNDGLPDEEL